MTKFAALLPALALLAACGSEPAAEPAPVETAAPAPVSTLPAPDQALFTSLLAETCEGAEPVNTAVCKRAGMGSTDVICEFGLGDDEYLRNKATLTANADSSAWVLSDAETICAQFGASQ